MSAPAGGRPADLAVVVVSTNEAAWLPACLGSVLARAGEARLDVVVVDNGSGDGTAELVERDFPQARVVRSENRGFPHANNVALVTCDARHCLLLNPDTEVLEGDFGTLVRWLDAHPGVGAIGVRQVDGEGRLLPTIRRFPTPLRALGEALGAERLPRRLRRPLTERELDPAAYERETACDWSVGSFLLLRREALLSAGLLDERLFLYSDEPDLCLRVRAAGWEVMHVPAMTIAHHARQTRGSARNEAQAAISRRVLARKHMPPARRALYLAALALRYGLRAAAPGPPDRRAVARSALRGLLGLGQRPYGEQPAVALPPRPPQSPADG